jgi:hypothetical protein
MKGRVILPVLTTVCCALAAACGRQDVSTGEVGGGERSKILKLHRELIDSHLSGDVGKLLAAEPETVMTVFQGEVSFQSKDERLEIFGRYLETTRFDEYTDLIEPIVHVSEDGTAAWLVAKVKISGAHSDSTGIEKPFDSIWAWIELYEKREGHWRRVGDVSNLKPASDN